MRKLNSFSKMQQEAFKTLGIGYANISEILAVDVDLLLVVVIFKNLFFFNKLRVFERQNLYHGLCSI